MVTIENGKLKNTPESNEAVVHFLNTQPKIAIKVAETGEIFALVPYLTDTDNQTKN